jgi:hypothetical protein
MNSSIANVHTFATLPPTLPLAGIPLVGNDSWERGRLVTLTPPGPAGSPARAASARKSGRLIETAWLRVPSASKNAASRNGSVGALTDVSGGQCS